MVNVHVGVGTSEPGISRMLKTAMNTAADGHHGQFRWDGSPYIKHPEVIASYMPDEDGKIVAWLHDVVEDTNITVNKLHKIGFPKYIVEAVIAITHRPNDTYAEYLIKVIENPIARRVKIADIAHNLISLMTDYPEKVGKIRKYKKALDYLI